jgi:hypothetical protein
MPAGVHAAGGNCYSLDYSALAYARTIRAGPCRFNADGQVSGLFILNPDAS